MKVCLIGGAPGVGKTTLGSALAVKLGITSLSVDDLMTAAQVVTSPESHPGLHIMSKANYLDYFTASTVDQLIADANAQHEAVWPIVERIIRRHAASSSAIVIDGWHLRPSRVAELDLDNVWSAWIVATPEVIRERERSNTGWLQGSSDPERMLDHFVQRSLWHNRLIEREAAELGMSILIQKGDTSVSELVDQVLADLLRERRGPTTG